MANKGYGAIGLIGGSTGFVDKIDGALLADKDICAVFMQSGQTRIYVLDADSGLDEDTTNYSVITPDTNAGTKRWILTWSGGRVIIPDSTVDQGDNAVVGTLAWHIADSANSVRVLAGTHSASTAITLRSDFELYGEGTASILKIADSVAAPFHLLDGSNCDNVRIDNLKLDGNFTGNSGETHVGGGGRAIYAASMTDSFLTRLTITDTWSHAIHLSGADHVKVDAIVTDIKGSFLGLTNCTDIEANIFGDTTSGSLSGIKIDGGRRITLINPVVKDAGGSGIHIDCLDSDVDGVEIIGGSVHGSASNGFTSARSSGSNSIKNIRITGGEYYENDSSGIYLQDNTIGTIINGVAAYNNGNLAGAPHKAGFRVAEATRTIISGCRGYDDQGTETQLYGIEIASTGSLVELYGNQLYNNVTKDLSVHASATNVVVDGFLARSTTLVESSGTGEDNLATVDVPQYAYLKYVGVRVHGAGYKTGANGNKTLKLHFGTKELTFNAAANDTTDWQVDAVIMFNSSATQVISLRGYNGTTLVQEYDSASIDMSAADTTLKITGECAHADDVISQRLWLVEYF